MSVLEAVVVSARASRSEFEGSMAEGRRGCLLMGPCAWTKCVMMPT